VWYTRRVRTSAWIGVAAVLLGAGLVGAGCAPPKDEVRVIDQASSVVQAVNDKVVQQAGALAASGSPLDGAWILDPGSLTVPTTPETLPTLTVGNGSVSGFAGCNTYQAGSAIVADQLLLETISTTEQACGPEAAAVEQAYLGALAEVGGFRIEGERLVLVDLGGQAILSFTR
jgi:heat shock protein HslJ